MTHVLEDQLKGVVEEAEGEKTLKQVAQSTIEEKT